MRRAAGSAVAGVVAMLCAGLCVMALAGCQSHSAATQPVSGVVTPSGTSTAAPSGAGSANGAANANSTTSPAGAGVDSDLNAVDSQLAELDSAVAQATQSPSDGG